MIRTVLGHIAACAGVAGSMQPAAQCALLQRSFDRLQDDKPQSLCQYAGKVLVVNTQLLRLHAAVPGLEALHASMPCAAWW